MADQTSGNGERLKQAAENALLTLASRWIVVILVPATLAMGGFIGKSVWDDIQEMKMEIRNQYAETARTISGINVRLSVTETRVDALERARP